MKPTRARAAMLAWTLLIVTSLSGCASPPLAVTPEIQSPPASLLRSNSESAEQHSQKAQGWLSKVRALFEKWNAPTRGCAATQPNSGACS